MFEKKKIGKGDFISINFTPRVLLPRTFDKLITDSQIIRSRNKIIITPNDLEISDLFS